MAVSSAESSASDVPLVSAIVGAPLAQEPDEQPSPGSGDSTESELLAHAMTLYDMASRGGDTSSAGSVDPQRALAGVSRRRRQRRQQRARRKRQRESESGGSSSSGQEPAQTPQPPVVEQIEAPEERQDAAIRLAEDIATIIRVTPPAQTAGSAAAGAGSEAVGYGVTIDDSVSGESALPEAMLQRRVGRRKRRQASGFVAPKPEAVVSGRDIIDSAEGRCKLCYWALKGVLTGPARSKRQRVGDGSTDRDLHNGIRFLSAVKQLRDSAIPFTSNDEVCAAIAREWNRVISNLYGAGEEAGGGAASSSSAPKTTGEMVDAFLREMASSQPDSQSAGAQTPPVDVKPCIDDLEEQADSYMRSLETDDRPSEPEQPRIPSLTTDDVIHHFEECVDDIVHVMRREVLNLQDIQSFLVSNSLFSVLKDVNLDGDDEDGAGSPPTDAPTARRRVIDGQGLSMYLATLQALRGLSSEIRATNKDSGPPAAYPALALRRVMDDSAHAGRAITGGAIKKEAAARSGRTTGF